MARMLYIVSRQSPQLYDYLRRRCERDPEAEVVYDRRVGERRRGGAAVNVERRASGRRRQSIDQSLRDLGWALVGR
jgi:hypothetical protein